MKQSLNLFLGSAMLLSLASCGNAGGEKAETDASVSATQYFRFEISGQEANIKHEFNMGTATLSAAQYQSNGTVNRIMATDDKYTVSINVAGSQPSTLAYQGNVNFIEIELVPGDLMMKVMGGDGTFVLKSLDVSNAAEGSFEGQLYLKRQLHDVKCEFRAPYPVVQQPTQAELDAKQRIIDQTQAERPQTIPVEGQKSTTPPQTREERDALINKK